MKKRMLIFGSFLLVILYISFASAVCGDGICDEGEMTSCLPDCEEELAGDEGVGEEVMLFECGDEVCDEGETIDSCPEDCSGELVEEVMTECGDGLCDVGEDENCPEDCVEIVAEEEQQDIEPLAEQESSADVLSQETSEKSFSLSSTTIVMLIVVVLILIIAGIIIFLFMKVFKKDDSNATSAQTAPNQPTPPATNIPAKPAPANTQ